MLVDLSKSFDRGFFEIFFVFFRLREKRLVSVDDADLLPHAGVVFQEMFMFGRDLVGVVGGDVVE